MSDVTRILTAIEQGDGQAAEKRPKAIRQTIAAPVLTAVASVSLGLCLMFHFHNSSTTTGMLRLSVPAFISDIACKISQPAGGRQKP